MGDVPGQVRQQFGGDSPVEPLDLSAPRGRATVEWMRWIWVSRYTRSRLPEVKVRAVVGIEHLRQAVDGPSEIGLAVDGLVQGQRGLLGRRSPGEQGVPGKGAVMVNRAGDGTPTGNVRRSLRCLVPSEPRPIVIVIVAGVRMPAIRFRVRRPLAAACTVRRISTPEPTMTTNMMTPAGPRVSPWCAPPGW